MEKTSSTDEGMEALEGLDVNYEVERVIAGDSSDEEMELSSDLPNANEKQSIKNTYSADQLHLDTKKKNKTLKPIRSKKKRKTKN